MLVSCPEVHDHALPAKVLSPGARGGGGRLGTRLETILHCTSGMGTRLYLILRSVTFRGDEPRYIHLCTHPGDVQMHEREFSRTPGQIKAFIG